MLTVKNNQFLSDGKPFFWLADTCWSAFTNISESDWHYYLDQRQRQGFNVVQINVLRQWDASGSNLDIDPFPIVKTDQGYSYDYSVINSEYFDRAERMLQDVVNHGMTPALVLLWSNYVPGTWASKLARNNLFTYNHLADYVTYVTRRFAKFHPVYFISGDTDFPTDETVRYYQRVLTTAQENDHQALYSFHIKGRLQEIPEEFRETTDFFSYQSGHNLAGQATAYTIPQTLLKTGYSKPIVNTEPCYEQISYSRNLYGRYRPENVRQAAWSAVLSGASAGITYGAHGIWSWHTTGASFGIVEGEGFDTPFDWHDALKFPGATDMTLLKAVMQRYFIEGCFPLSEPVTEKPSIRAAKGRDGHVYVIYVPTNTVLDLAQITGMNRANARITVLDLDNKQVEHGVWMTSNKMALSSALSDSLVVVQRMEDNQNVQ